MASKNLLHKTRLQEFLGWCKAQGIDHGPGRGDYQLATVYYDGKPHVIYERLFMPEHVTVPQPLVKLVLRFLRETR